MNKKGLAFPLRQLFISCIIVFISFYFLGIQNTIYIVFFLVGLLIFLYINLFLSFYNKLQEDGK